MKTLFSLLAVVLCVSVPAQAQEGFYEDVNPKPPPVPYLQDSGVLDNPEADPQTVWQHEVRMQGAGWLRLYFGETELPEGSFLRVTSELDGEFQELDAATLAMWSNASAFFNGEAVTLELVAGPGTVGNRVELQQLLHQDAGSFESLCGADDRVSSDVDWAGRVEPIGCSGGMVTEDGCMVSAGHCFGPGAATVIEFRVPLNNNQCQNQHPPVADQFPITGTRQSVNGGVGNDWAVAIVGTNSLGETHYERYGVIRPIALEVPSLGTEMQIFGYGSDTCQVSGTQQFSEGEVTLLQTNALFHNADTTGGNSGTAITSNGYTIAAHTHAGCPTNGSTRIDQNAFAVARANICIPEAALVGFQNDVYSCGDTMTVVVQDSSIIGAGSQNVTLSSDTENGTAKALTASVSSGWPTGSVSSVLQMASRRWISMARLTASMGVSKRKRLPSGSSSRRQVGDSFSRASIMVSRRATQRPACRSPKRSQTLSRSIKSTKAKARRVGPVEGSGIWRGPSSPPTRLSASSTSAALWGRLAGFFSSIWSISSSKSLGASGTRGRRLG